MTATELAFLTARADLVERVLAAIQTLMVSYSAEERDRAEAGLAGALADMNGEQPAKLGC